MESSILNNDCIEYIYKILHKSLLEDIHNELISAVHTRRKCIIYSGLANIKQKIYTEPEFIQLCRQQFPGPPLNYFRDLDDEFDFELLGWEEGDWEHRYVMEKLPQFEAMEDSNQMNVVDWLVFTGAIKFDENHNQIYE